MSDFVSIPEASQFKFTPIYKDGDTIRFGLRQTPISPRSSYRIYTVTPEMENRLDLISNAFYGDPSFWWVIADANNMTDPLAAVPIGSKLRMPPASTVRGLVN